MTIAKRKGGLVPRDDAGILLAPLRLKEHVATITPKERQRLVAFLSTIYTGPQLIEMLGIKKTYLRWCRKEHPAIIEAAMLSRNFAIADMTERRTIELLQTMNVDNIADDKKPAAVKYLVDAGAIARKESKPKAEETENVQELIFRVRQKMTQQNPPDES